MVGECKRDQTPRAIDRRAWVSFESSAYPRPRMVVGYVDWFRVPRDNTTAPSHLCHSDPQPAVVAGNWWQGR
jgi:hypothetical protein